MGTKLNRAIRSRWTRLVVLVHIAYFVSYPLGLWAGLGRGAASLFGACVTGLAAGGVDWLLRSRRQLSYGSERGHQAPGP